MLAACARFEGFALRVQLLRLVGLRRGFVRPIARQSGSMSARERREYERRKKLKIASSLRHRHLVLLRKPGRDVSFALSTLDPARTPVPQPKVSFASARGGGPGPKPVSRSPRRLFRAVNYFPYVAALLRQRLCRVKTKLRHEAASRRYGKTGDTIGFAPLSQPQASRPTLIYGLSGFLRKRLT